MLTMANVPTWLNKHFIEKIIQNSELKTEVTKVLNITVAPATAKGDNYASDMLRVTIEYDDMKSDKKTKSLVIKLSPQQGIQKDLITQLGMFDNEISMMTNTLKKMNSLVGPTSRFSSTAFYTQSEDPVLLVLEDLCSLGFRMANRYSGLDMEHTMLAIRALAKFHAASVALCEKEPHQKSYYNKGVYSSLHPPEMAGFFNNTIRLLADEVANWPEAKQYATKLSALSLHAYDLAISAAEKSENEFNVITHGDYWVNNMLFRYENEKPIVHMMADFQLSYYASPVLDLLYFFNTSISEEIYLNHKNVVLEEYHKTLSATMKNLGCKTKTPNFVDLQKSMKKRAILGVIAGMTVLPIVLVDKSKVKDVNEMLSADGEVIDNPGLKGETFRKIMAKRLPLFDADGLLN